MFKTVLIRSMDKVPENFKCILGCNLSEMDRLYQFPYTDEEKVVMWLKTINKAELILPTGSSEFYRNYLICHKHFSSIMFTKSNNLIKAAIPDLELKPHNTAKMRNNQLDFIDHYGDGLMTDMPTNSVDPLATNENMEEENSVDMDEENDDPLGCVRKLENDEEMEKNPPVVEIVSVDDIKKSVKNYSDKKDNDPLRNSTEKSDLLSSVKSFLSSQGLSTDSDKLPANNDDLNFIQKMLSKPIEMVENVKETSSLASTSTLLPSTSLKLTNNTITTINKMDDFNLDKVTTNTNVSDKSKFLLPQKQYNLRKTKLIDKNGGKNQISSSLKQQIKSSPMQSSKVQMTFDHLQSQVASSSSMVSNEWIQKEILRYCKENPRSEEIVNMPEHIVVSTVFLKSPNIRSNEELLIPVEVEDNDESFKDSLNVNDIQGYQFPKKYLGTRVKTTQTNFPLIPETIREILSQLSLDMYDGKYKSIILKLHEILSIYIDDNDEKQDEVYDYGINDNLFMEKTPLLKLLLNAPVRPTCHRHVEAKPQRTHRQCQTKIKTKDVSTMTDEDENNKKEIDSEEELFMEAPPNNDPRIVKLGEENYECIVCCFVTKHLSYARSHMQIHEEKCSLCYYCGKLCKDSVHLRAHESKCIPEDLRNAQTRKCVTDLNDKMYTKSSDGKYICEICKAEFKKYPQIRAHRFTHLDKDYVCTVCNRIFKSPYDLREHRRLAHLNKMVKCEKCSKLVNLRFYKKHLDSHDAKFYDCNKCGSKSLTRCVYKQHQKVSCKKEKVCNMCIFCNCKLSKNKKTIKYHFYDEQHIENELKWKSDNNVKAYKCLRCYRCVYMDFYNYMEHCWTHALRLTYKRPDYLNELLESCVRNSDDTDDIDLNDDDNNDNLMNNKIITDNQNDDRITEDKSDLDESDLEDLFNTDDDDDEDDDSNSKKPKIIHENNTSINIALNRTNNDNSNIQEKRNNFNQMINNGNNNFQHEKLKFKFTVENIQLPNLTIIQNDDDYTTAVQNIENYTDINNTLVSQNENDFDVDNLLIFNNKNYNCHDQSIAQRTNQNYTNNSNSIIEDYIHTDNINNYPMSNDSTNSYHKTEDEIFKEIIEDETETIMSSNYEYH